MARQLKVIDTHFHLWNLERQSLPWLDDTDGTITHTYTLKDYLDAWGEVSFVDFLGGVYVEIDCADYYQEDEVVWDLLTREGGVKILGCAMRSRVAPWMRLPLYACAVREPLHIPGNPKGRCLEPSFIDGLRALAAAGIPFESCNRTDELEDAYEAFSQVPEATIILNHVGNVESLDRKFQAVMQKFASLPNLYLKVSGYPTGDRSFVQELTSFTRETFDKKRLLFASNWPVIKMYSDLVEHVELCREEFGDDEHFWYKNALEAYHLKG